jgi:hypothetical protein
MAGGAATVFVPQAHEGRISPDGALAAAHKQEGGDEKLALYSMADGSLVRILPGEATGGFQWQPDGTALIGRASGDGLDNFFRIPIDGGPRVQISHYTATDSIFLTAIHQDGRIAFSRGESNFDVVLLKRGK